MKRWVGFVGIACVALQALVPATAAAKTRPDRVGARVVTFTVATADATQAQTIWTRPGFGPAGGPRESDPGATGIPVHRGSGQEPPKPQIVTRILRF